jgi:hypothetical protein
MQSYNEWKARQIYTENSRSVPYVPSSEMGPIGNGKDPIAHQVAQSNNPTFDSTAPSSNSGGMIRKQYDWETFINDKYANAKSEIPEELPSTSGLGDKGNQVLSKTSFPEDPMNTDSDEIQDIEGQFDHCSWEEFSKLQENAALSMLQKAKPVAAKLIGILGDRMKTTSPKIMSLISQAVTELMQGNMKGAYQNVFNRQNVQHARDIKTPQPAPEAAIPSGDDPSVGAATKGGNFHHAKKYMGGPMTTHRMMSKR